MNEQGINNEPQYRLPLKKNNTFVLLSELLEDSLGCLFGALGSLLVFIGRLQKVPRTRLPCRERHWAVFLKHPYYQNMSSLGPPPKADPNTRSLVQGIDPTDDLKKTQNGGREVRQEGRRPVWGRAGGQQEAAKVQCRREPESAA